MKTLGELLEGKYTIVHNKKIIVFNAETPMKLARLLIDLYQSKKRVVFDYGDIKTNESWGEVYDITGTIGLTKGHYDLHYPILLHNSRSIGGGMILTHCIVEVAESKGKRSLYKNEIKQDLNYFERQQQVKEQLEMDNKPFEDINHS